MSAYWRPVDRAPRTVHFVDTRSGTPGTASTPVGSAHTAVEGEHMGAMPWEMPRPALVARAGARRSMPRPLIRRARVAVAIALFGCGVAPALALPLTNDSLAVAIDAQAGAYRLGPAGGRPVLQATVGALVDHRWLHPADYPAHTQATSPFSDALGAGHQVTTTYSGRKGSPDLVCVVQLYANRPYGTVQVLVRNATRTQATVQAIRSVEAMGDAIVDLGGQPADERVLSDSFSEDWPDLVIRDLVAAPGGMHRGVGSQLVYDRKTGQSLFLGALSSDRFLTVLRLQAAGDGAAARLAAYTVDSTGTTEIQRDYSPADSLKSMTSDRIELSLPLRPGAVLASERLLFATGSDYLEQLRAYGAAIRQLHAARVSSEIPIGWWSWTAFYAAINEGEVLANADWLARHLAPLGFRYFQVDEGYQYARGEYLTANATQFPDGMGLVAHRIVGDGLTLGLWTAPFEVSRRSWVYEHHKDWLVHNARGRPIPLEDVWDQASDTLYALDTTHPQAQQYLRQTYRTLVHEWGVRFIKLDFMDTTAIEGYYYRPATTALEAQRIGLQVIRAAVGESVVLDKDGSPMLNPVGIVDTGRVSADTGHTFLRTKTAAPGIAARFYMNGNFFINDPDAFNVTDSYLVENADERAAHTLEEAQASIALSAIAGGMYEIGDDLLVLGSEPERLALVGKRDLLDMARGGRASTPVDLLSYDERDGQPSVFVLRQSPRQSIVTVFNWTDAARTRVLALSDLGLAVGAGTTATVVLGDERVPALEHGTLRLRDQPPRSALVIKLVDPSLARTAPAVTARVPAQSTVGQTLALAAQAAADGVPALAYHWDFGDGTVADGPRVTHCYTRAAQFTVHLTVEGPDDAPYEQVFTVGVSGALQPTPQLRANRRFEAAADR